MNFIPVIVSLGAGIATFAVASSLQCEHFVKIGLSGFKTGTIRKSALAFGVGALAAIAVSPHSPQTPAPATHIAARVVG